MASDVHMELGAGMESIGGAMPQRNEADTDNAELQPRGDGLDEIAMAVMSGQRDSSASG